MPNFASMIALSANPVKIKYQVYENVAIAIKPSTHVFKIVPFMVIACSPLSVWNESFFKTPSCRVGFGILKTPF